MKVTFTRRPPVGHDVVSKKPRVLPATRAVLKSDAVVLTTELSTPVWGCWSGTAGTWKVSAVPPPVATNWTARVVSTASGQLGGVPTRCSQMSSLNRLPSLRLGGNSLPSPLKMVRVSWQGIFELLSLESPAWFLTIPEPILVDAGQTFALAWLNLHWANANLVRVAFSLLFCLIPEPRLMK